MLGMDWVLELNVLGRGSISLRRERAIIAMQREVQLVFILDKLWSRMMKWQDEGWIHAALVVLVRVNFLLKGFW